MGFSRQEYWSGLPCPPPGDLLDPGIKLTSASISCIAGGFFTYWTTKEDSSLPLALCYYFLQASYSQPWAHVRITRGTGYFENSWCPGWNWDHQNQISRQGTRASVNVKPLSYTGITWRDFKIDWCPDLAPDQRKQNLLGRASNDQTVQPELKINCLKCSTLGDLHYCLGISYHLHGSAFQISP